MNERPKYSCDTGTLRLLDLTSWHQRFAVCLKSTPTVFRPKRTPRPAARFREVQLVMTT
jgi:hypothetical protein